MKYRNAKDILPDELLKQLQQYADGMLLYVPSSNQPKSWGEASGCRDRLLRRNRVIRSLYRNGRTISELADEYFLSIDSIKKIVYGKKEEIPAFSPDVTSAMQYADLGLAEEWVRIWLKSFGGAEPASDQMIITGVVRIPLRLIRTAADTAAEPRRPQPEPLIIFFKGGRFHVEYQPALLTELRAQNRNAYPALIIMEKDEYPSYMSCYGKHFQG